jgi:hypothetical protein
VQAKLASNDLSAALPIVLLLESITQKQPALLSSYLPQLKECLASFAGAHSLKTFVASWLCPAFVHMCHSNGWQPNDQLSYQLCPSLLIHAQLVLWRHPRKGGHRRCSEVVKGATLPNCVVLYCDAWWGAVLWCAGLASDTAMSLLLAVWPLCRVRSDLQDFVVMLLRKMMYRQDVDGR